MPTHYTTGSFQNHQQSTPTVYRGKHVVSRPW